ncbi:hypothetical protein MEA186_34364 [Mesorhizobium amorphae CCNWGS0123]|uniref:Uncharacterized protein n=1 Tax=Mesorhizobium amorphae CCNWGS0123 TaxID=1082933 RepID=G6YLI5_9HYPH|nr:hypothetical protein MEA186_34364 [Mesorhizobium amorphae CCNWGS0123]
MRSPPLEDENLLDLSEEALAIARSIEQARCGNAIMARPCEEAIARSTWM